MKTKIMDEGMRKAIKNTLEAKNSETRKRART